MWPLSYADKEQFDKLKSSYAHRNVESLIPLEVECDRGWFFDYYRAENPATEHDLAALPADLKRFKFLSYQAQSMHTSLFDFLQTVCASRGKPGLHLPAVMIAAEFRRWVNKLGGLERADEGSQEEINRRIQLIDDIQMTFACRETDHLLLLQTMGSVRGILQSILNKWNFYQAQENIQDNLKEAWLDTAQVLRSMLIYIFYAMRGDEMSLSFDPSTFLIVGGDSISDELLESARGTLSGKMMQHLLLDPYVQLVVRQEEGFVQQSIEGFPRVDKEPGRRELEKRIGCRLRLEDGAFEAGNSGFVTQEDCGLRDYKKAVDLLLKLHTRTVALARCVKLMKSAHKMSSLGGDQLLALLAQKPSNKSLVDSVFSFTRKELEATAKDSEILHNMLLQGHLAMKTSKTWFTNYGFERWSKFFSFANTYRENLNSYVQSAVNSIDRLTERISKLSSADVQMQLDAEAQSFQITAVATLADFGDGSLLPKSVATFIKQGALPSGNGDWRSSSATPCLTMGPPKASLTWQPELECQSSYHNQPHCLTDAPAHEIGSRRLRPVALKLEVTEHDIFMPTPPGSPRARSASPTP